MVSLGGEGWFSLAGCCSSLWDSALSFSFRFSPVPGVVLPIAGILQRGDNFLFTAPVGDILRMSRVFSKPCKGCCSPSHFPASSLSIPFSPWEEKAENVAGMMVGDEGHPLPLLLLWSCNITSEWATNFKSTVGRHPANLFLKYRCTIHLTLLPKEICIRSVGTFSLSKNNVFNIVQKIDYYNEMQKICSLSGGSYASQFWRSGLWRITLFKNSVHFSETVF